jgi:hypothetical protein
MGDTAVAQGPNVVGRQRFGKSESPRHRATLTWTAEPAPHPASAMAHCCHLTSGRRDSLAGGRQVALGTWSGPRSGEPRDIHVRWTRIRLKRPRPSEATSADTGARPDPGDHQHVTQVPGLVKLRSVPLDPEGPTDLSERDGPGCRR